MEQDRYASYPSAVAYEKPDGKEAVEHLLWGFWVKDKGERRGDYEDKDIHGNPVSGKYVRVHCRGHREDRWIREHQLQDERLLEVIFVDIGQGDGCLVVTPKDRMMVIDAGEKDNMYRFLKWRFGGFRSRFEFEAGIMSHPDQDHYKGFSHLFENDNVFFDTIYHNGIMEQFGNQPLGAKRKDGRRSFLTELIKDKEDLKAFLAKKDRWQKLSRGRTIHKQFPKLLSDALAQEKFKHYKMLSLQDGFLPGYGPEKDLSIKVLGPLVEPDQTGKPRLRWITNTGKTKNGHSVVLRLQYHQVSMLLGGDLNIPSEHLLLSHHTGMQSPPKRLEDEEALVEAARKAFQVDIAKSCHHGSPDFTNLYLKAINPIATVISSGDNEPHSHPRADTLGTIGLYSRGARPLIFSTELARSAPEQIKHPSVLRRELEKEFRAIDKMPENTEAQKEKKAKRRRRVEEKINRSVAVFGAINVITDGKKVVIAQKLERKRGNDEKWDIYRLEAKGNGPLRFISKH